MTTAGDKVVMLPFLGEFGHLVMKHLRWVHAFQSQEKIVCCQPGEQCYYPSSTGFFTDWRHPVPDGQRSGESKSRLSRRFFRRLRARLQSLYPGYRIVAGDYRGWLDWAEDPRGKCRPQSASHFATMDVVLAPRHRILAPDRNWPLWSVLGSYLHALGLRVGLAGCETTSVDFPAEAKAWQHPQGASAGTVDLLSHCRLYLGTNSGVAHLACLMDVPSLILIHPPFGHGRLLDHMQRSNQVFCKLLPRPAWHSVDEVVAAVQQQLQE